jgi:hypothetical protein
MTKESGFDSRKGKEVLSLLYNIQTASGAHPASCGTATGGKEE